MLRWRELDDDDLIRFRCAECDKMLGAKPGMSVVVCSRCRLVNDVPTARDAAESLSHPVRIVSVDIPLRQLLRLGVKVSVAAIPLVFLLAVAACGVVMFASTTRDRPADRGTEVSTPVAPPDAAEVTTDAPERPGLWVGIGGVLLVVFGSFLTVGIVHGRTNATDPLAVALLAWFFLAFVPLLLGGVMCWRYFA